MLTVDLDAVVANWRSLAAEVGPGPITGAVVKAEAYGLGMAPVARALAAAGCRWFWVATEEEALTLAALLRPAPADLRIAVLSGPQAAAATAFLEAPALVPVLNDLAQLALWRHHAPGRPAILHLDTGMARLGFPAEEQRRLAGEPALLEDVPLAAIISHLACADEPAAPLNLQQREAFERISACLPPAPRSLAASFGIFLGAAFHYDMVRPGAALYGINPRPWAANPMRQVVRLEARVLQLRQLRAGDNIGYGGLERAAGPMRLATLGVGYADGVPRQAGRQARCWFGGVAAPIIGRVSMDLLMADVSNVPPPLVFPGGFADLIGPQQGVDAFAADCGTVGYEILTRLGPRLHRRYRGAAS